MTLSAYTAQHYWCYAIQASFQHYGHTILIEKVKCTIRASVHSCIEIRTLNTRGKQKELQQKVMLNGLIKVDIVIALTATAHIIVVGIKHEL